MIRPKNLQNVLNLWSSIIIRGEVHILRSSDTKDLGYVVRIDEKLFSSYLAFYLNSNVSGIWEEFSNQLFHRVFEIPE